MRLLEKPVELVFDNNHVYVNGKLLYPDVRTAAEMYCVFRDRVAAKSLSPSQAMYFMYRDVYPRVKQHCVRYDITVLPYWRVGKETSKTLGHFHSERFKSLSYPEIYEVLYGEAAFLFQKVEKGRVIDFICIHAKAGDKIPVPPNYGHCTVNTGVGPLVLANLMCPKAKSSYKEFISRSGAAYYLLSNDKLVPNKSYGKLPKPNVIRHVGATFEGDLLAAFYRNPRHFTWLCNPKEWSGLLGD